MSDSVAFEQIDASIAIYSFSTFFCHTRCRESGEAALPRAGGPLWGAAMQANDNGPSGGGRREEDRRKQQATDLPFPDRRSGTDRRSGKDRRSADRIDPS